MTNDTRLDRVLEIVSEIHGVCGKCQEQIGRHEVTLNGNGREGLVSEVKAVKTEIKSVWKTLLDFRGQVRRAKWTGIGAVISAAVAAIGAAAAWVFGLIKIGS